MTMNGGPGYNILLVGDEGEYQLFQSANNSWTRPERMPPSFRLPLRLRLTASRPVAVEGRLYFMRSDPDGLLSYEVDSGKWRQYEIPAPPHMSVGQRVVAECGGRIMLVGLLTMEDEAKCVCVWELQEKTLVWKEVDRMPEIWCLEFRKTSFVMIKCLGNKGLVMISLDLNQKNRLFTYDLSTGNGSSSPAVSCRIPAPIRPE